MSNLKTRPDSEKEANLLPERSEVANEGQVSDGGNSSSEKSGLVQKRITNWQDSLKYITNWQDSLKYETNEEARGQIKAIIRELIYLKEDLEKSFDEEIKQKKENIRNLNKVIDDTIQYGNSGINELNEIERIKAEIKLINHIRSEIFGEK